MISRLLIGVLSLVLLEAQTSLTPPRGWSLEEQPAKLVLTPDSLRHGQTVRAELYDVEPATGDLMAWFQSRLDSLGDPASATCRPKRGKGSVNCMVKNPGQDDYFYGIELRGGQYRLIHYVMGPSTLSAAAHIMTLGRIMKDAQAGLGHSTVAAAATAPPVANPPAAGTGKGGWPTAHPAPGPGATAAATPAATPATATRYEPPLEALYLHLAYTAGVGGMVYPTYEPYIFLKDGTFTDDLDYYPQSESDLPRWRAHKPRRWGAWTRNGSTLNLRWNDPKNKPETWDKWFDARRGDRDMKLSGLYRSMGGGGNSAMGGTVTVAAWSDFSFSPNGTVTSGGGSGGFSGGPGASVATSAQKKAQQAQYRIRNYTVQLAYPDGRSETRWFYRFPDSDNVIGIGGSTFVLSK